MKYLQYLAQFKKGLAALVAAIVSAGGIAVLFPGLSGSLAATITGAVSLLAVVLAPKNEVKAPGLAPDQPTNPGS
jgi:hypothetical protein